jgi:hypothetical protein
MENNRKEADQLDTKLNTFLRTNGGNPINGESELSLNNLSCEYLFTHYNKIKENMSQSPGNSFKEIMETIKTKYNKRNGKKLEIETKIKKIKKQLDELKKQQRYAEFYSHIKEQNGDSRQQDIDVIVRYLNRLQQTLQVEQHPPPQLEMLRVEKGRCTATKMVLMHLVTGQYVKSKMVDQTISLVETLYNSSNLDTTI